MELVLEDLNDDGRNGLDQCIVLHDDAFGMDDFWLSYDTRATTMTKIGRERGWGETTREQFEHEVEHGSLYVGSPETVARKIASTVSALGLSRFDLKYSSGPLQHEHLMETIEHYGRTVIPRVRELLS